MLAGGLALAALWVASMAPLAWPPLAAHAEGLSRTALAALPWIACLGLPRGARARAQDAPSRGPASDAPSGPGALDRLRSGALARSLGLALLALPPLALGLALDLAAGATAGRAWSAAEAWASLALLAYAAERAAGARLHAWAWLALVPGASALVAALELGGGAPYGDAPAAVVALARLSPLDACLRTLGDGAEPARAPLALLGAASLALLAVASTRRKDAA